jgi:hypothetical protein
MEALITYLEAPRGFWGHTIGMPRLASTAAPRHQIWGPDGPPRVEGRMPSEGQPGAPPDAEDLSLRPRDGPE